MSLSNLTIIGNLEAGTNVIKAKLSNINCVTLWAEGYNLKGSYPYPVKFSFILIGLPNRDRSFLFDLLTCPELINLLGPLLESSTIIKVIFNHAEIRQSLWNELKINLTSIFDVHLAIGSKVKKAANFKAICTCFGLENEFLDKVDVNKARFWLERPLTQKMLNISRENIFLLHQIYQNLSFGLTELTHDLKILQWSPPEIHVQKIPPPNQLELINSEALALAVITELLQKPNLRNLGVKWSHLDSLGMSVDLLIIGTRMKTYVFVMSVFPLEGSTVIAGLKSILEQPYLIKIVFGTKTVKVIKEKIGIDLEDVYDLNKESSRIVPSSEHSNRTLWGLCKYTNPDLPDYLKIEMTSEDVLKSIRAHIVLYFNLFEHLRRLHNNVRRVPSPKILKVPKLIEIPTPGSSCSNHQGIRNHLNKCHSETIKALNFDARILPFSEIIAKHKDFESAGAIIRDFKVISLDCKSNYGISLIVIGIPGKVFIFDVNSKPKKGLGILRGIIEDNEVKKIMYQASEMLVELKIQLRIIPKNILDVGEANSEALEPLMVLKMGQAKLESTHPNFWKRRPVGDPVRLGLLPQIASFLILNNEILVKMGQGATKGLQQPKALSTPIMPLPPNGPIFKYPVPLHLPQASVTSAQGITFGQHLSVNINGQEPLSVFDLASMHPNDQKHVLGDRLFPLVHEKYPMIAGKLTGILLGLDNAMLLKLLGDRDLLNSAIEEALDVFRNPDSIKFPQVQLPPARKLMGNDIGMELKHLRKLIENLSNENSKGNLLHSVDHVIKLAQKQGEMISTFKGYKTDIDTSIKGPQIEGKKACSKSVQTIFTGTIYGCDISHEDS